MIVEKKISDDGAGKQQQKFYGESGKKTTEEQPQRKTDQAEAAYFFHRWSPCFLSCFSIWRQESFVHGRYGRMDEIFVAGTDIFLFLFL